MKWKSLPLLVLAAAVALVAAAPAGAQILFDAQLSGEAEVPQVATDAFGSCVGILSDFPGDPSFAIACEHNVEGAVAAHIHEAPPGVAGGIVFPFANPFDIDATWDLSVEEAIKLLAGLNYVNVHTPTFPNGEIRGQLLPRPGSADVEVVSFPLSGDQEAPPVVSDATGLCVVVVERDGAVLETGTLDVYCTHDVVNPVAAHIHSSPPGVAGPIVVPFDDPTSPIVAEDIELDFQLASDLRDGDLYVNVHTAENPTGEIRGQIVGCFASPTVLCLANNRFAVEVDFETSQGGGAAGQGVGVRETGNTGMFWFFEPSNLEILIKVLDACPVNDHRWVFLSGTTNVGFDLTVTDTVTGESNTYSNEDLEVATPQLDTAAFECE